MAEHEADREDLLREATALVQRAELLLPDSPEPIVAGFRRDGAASFFFGVDPVVQFNARRELRRAFHGGRLIKAEAGRLVALDRRRTATEVQLVRQELSAEESQALRTEFAARLEALRQTLRDGSATVVGQVPTEGDVVGRIAGWLEELAPPLVIARSPNVAS